MIPNTAPVGTLSSIGYSNDFSLGKGILISVFTSTFLPFGYTSDIKQIEAYQNSINCMKSISTNPLPHVKCNYKWLFMIDGKVKVSFNCPETISI